MSMLLIDGFDHYGTDTDGTAAMLTSVYTQVPTGTTVGPGVPSWGTRTGFASVGVGGGTGDDMYRCPLPASQTNILVTMGFSVADLPSTESEQGVISFRDSNNKALAELWLTSYGALELRGPWFTSGGTLMKGTILASTNSSVIKPETWHSLEMEIDTGARSFVLRVDDTYGTGTPALNVTTLVFGRTSDGTKVANSPMTQIGFLQRTPITVPTITSAWVDDLVVRNNLGTVNNGFKGETFVCTSWPLAPVIPPVTLPSTMSFNVVDLSTDATMVDAIVTVVRGHKTTSGLTGIMPTIVTPSNNSLDGSTQYFTTTDTYINNIFEVSPDTGLLTPTIIVHGATKIKPVINDQPPVLTQYNQLTVYRSAVPNRARQKSWTFNLDGHTFYVLDLGEEGTFAYDKISDQWCQLYTQGFDGQWNFANGIMWGDRIIAGDLIYNTVWELDPNQTQDEDWRAIKHIVTGGISTRARSYASCAFIRLVASSGITQSVAPSTITLNFSDDNGSTWSPDFPIEIKSGDTNLDIQWPSLGSFSTPGRIFKFTDTGGMIRIDGADVSLANYKNNTTDGDR